MRNIRAIVLVLSLVVFGLAGMSAAADPKLDISDQAAARGLNAAETKQVSDYITFYVKALAGADEAAKVFAAKSKLMDAFTRYPAAAFEGVYSAEVGKQISESVLSRQPEVLGALKETNAAMLLSDIARPAIRTTFQSMLTHPNDAVRMFAWRGVKRILPDVLAGGAPGAGELLGAMSKAAQSETCGIVEEDAFKTLQVPAALPDAVKADDAAKLQQSMLEVLLRAWQQLAMAVAGGSEATSSESCRAGLASLTGSAEAMPKNAGAKQAILQALADMLYASSKAYNDAQGVGAAAELNAALLPDLEKAINAQTGGGVKAVADAIANAKTDKDKAVTARLAALEWIQKLAASGIVNPAEKFATPSPTSTPAGK